MVTRKSRKVNKKVSAKEKNKPSNVHSYALLGRPKVLKRNIKHAEKYYQLNLNWPYLDELKNLILKISPPSFPKIERGLSKIGRIKLAIITGTFLNMSDARVDIMVVGDDIDFKKFISFVKTVEEEIGTELQYVILGTDEFKYRYGMFDRFVHDILEYPHRKVIDKIKVTSYKL